MMENFGTEMAAKNKYPLELVEGGRHFAISTGPAKKQLVEYLAEGMRPADIYMRSRGAVSAAQLHGVISEIARYTLRVDHILTDEQRALAELIVKEVRGRRARGDGWAA